MPHRRCLVSYSEWIEYFVLYSSDCGQTRQAITCSFLHRADWFSWFIICKWTILWYDDHASCTLTGKPPLPSDTKETGPSVYITEGWNSVRGSFWYWWEENCPFREAHIINAQCSHNLQERCIQWCSVSYTMRIRLYTTNLSNIARFLQCESQWSVTEMVLVAI